VAWVACDLLMAPPVCIRAWLCLNTAPSHRFATSDCALSKALFAPRQSQKTVLAHLFSRITASID
jgi:hypothetical protein